MMSRLRILIAWLVMAAVPLQGLAAATMAFCGGEHHRQPAQVSAAEAGAHRHADGTTHEHTAAAAKALPDTNHKCGVCASCCNGVAIAQSIYSAAFVPLPQAELAEPFVLIHAPPSQLPDKPPRA